MPGGPGGPGGPGIPVGPRMPSLPCKSHRRVGGAAGAVPRRPSVILQSRGQKQLCPGGTNLLSHGSWWPGRTNLPWEARGPLKRREVLSEVGQCSLPPNSF